MIFMDDWIDYARFRAAITDVMDQRFYTPEWLDAEIWAGRARFWCTATSAIVATMKIYPTGVREVHGLVAVGGLDDIIMLISAAESWGRELGCIVAGIDSREGWGRQLKGFGYVPYQTCLRKELA